MTEGASARDAPHERSGATQRDKNVEVLRALRDFDLSSGRAAPRMLVLVGIPGSGKTTFGERLCSLGWGDRLCQDELRSRPAVERAVVEALVAGRNVIVDRCNFDGPQREHWVRLAKARGCHVGVVVFATPVAQCLARVNTRIGHPTLRDGDEKMNESVIHRMANSFVFPTKSEGFLFCRVVKEDADAERVSNEIMQV